MSTITDETYALVADNEDGLVHLGELDHDFAALESLEQIETIVRKHNGDWTNQDSNMLNLAVSSIMRTTGRNVKVPSLEGFHGKTASKISKQMSLEGVGDIIKSILQSLVDFVKKIADYFINLFNKQMKRGIGVANRAQDLVKKSQEIDRDAKPKTEQLQSSKFANFFINQGHPIAPSDIVTNYKNHIADSANIFNDALLRESSAKMEQIVHLVEGNAEESSVKTKIDEIIKSIQAVSLKHMVSLGKKQTGNDHTLTEEDYVYRYRFDNRVIDIKITERNNLAEHLKVSPRDDGKSKALKEIEVMKPIDVYNLATVIDSEMRVGSSKFHKDAENHIKKIEKSIIAACNKMDKAKDDLTTKKVRFSTASIGNLVKALVMLVSEVAKFDFVVADMCLSFGEESLKQYKVVKPTPNNSTEEINLSEESIKNRFLETINSNFTFDKTMLNYFDKLRNGEIDKVSFNTGIIKEPGWGRNIQTYGKNILDGSDVLKFLDEYEKEVNSKEARKFIKEFADFINDISDTLNSTILFPKQKVLLHLASLGKQADKLAEGFKDFNFSNRSVRDVDFKPLVKEECKELLSKVNTISSNTFVPNEFDYLRNAYTKYLKELGKRTIPQVIVARMTFLFGLEIGSVMSAVIYQYGLQDVVLANELINKLGKSFYSLAKLVDGREDLLFSSYRYIQQSIKG